MVKDIHGLDTAAEATGTEPAHWVMIRLGAMGDVTLTTGVLDYWHKLFGCRFTVVTKTEFAPLFAENPAVRRVVGLEKAALRGGRLWGTWRRLAHEYAGSGLLDLHGTLRSRLLGLLWKGPVRRYPKLALERRLFLASGGKWGGERLLTWNVPQRYALALPELCNGVPPDRECLRPKIYLSGQEWAQAERLLEGLSLGGTRPVALHPYATHRNKAWEASKWRQLAARLDQAGVPWVVVGHSPTRIMDRNSPRDLTGRTSLRETCALLACCRVLVTGDSGPMHLAASVDTPVVALFGPTTAHWGFYPAGASDTVIEKPLPCRPCGLHGGAPCKKGLACLADVDVETVARLAMAR